MGERSSAVAAGLEWLYDVIRGAIGSADLTSVLVVEDEALIADDIQRTLTRLGYEVPITAATGREAIHAVSERRPSVVLMDIKLRGAMDGIEAAREIRKQFDVPIVYLTSHSDEGTLERAKGSDP